MLTIQMLARGLWRNCRWSSVSTQDVEAAALLKEFPWIKYVVPLDRTLCCSSPEPIFGAAFGIKPISVGMLDRRIPDPHVQMYFMSAEGAIAGWVRIVLRRETVLGALRRLRAKQDDIRYVVATEVEHSTRIVHAGIHFFPPDCRALEYAEDLVAQQQCFLAKCAAEVEARKQQKLDTERQKIHPVFAQTQ